MARHYPDILLAGYADSLRTVRAKLGSYPARLYEADEHTTELSGEWRGAVVGYVVTFDTASSSQLRSVFAYLHDRLCPQHEIAILMPAVPSETVLFPELDAVRRVRMNELPAYVATLGEEPRE